MESRLNPQQSGILPTGEKKQNPSNSNEEDFLWFQHRSADFQVLLEGISCVGHTSLKLGSGLLQPRFLDTRQVSSYRH